MQIHDTANINKIFEKYLEPDEVIEYVTLSQFFPKVEKSSFLVWVFFCCCFFMFLFFTRVISVEIIIPIIFFAVFTYFAYYISIKRPELFFVQQYYCITNKRILSYTPLFNCLNQQSLDLVYRVNISNFHDVIFTNKYHFILFEFNKIPDADIVFEFMKGKIN